ncbi:MAG: NUDIX domain-containing protein [Actinomycetota bacterium]
MTDLAQRFADWIAEHDDPDAPATPAATVLILRDGSDGLEVLMVQRNSEGTFASNWVFPGGKVDAEDHDGDGDIDALDIVAASRIAASREAAEEADVVIDPSDLVPFSHWMPPTIVPRRFSTWFYATAAPAGDDGDVTIDGGEIVDHVWVAPSAALARQAAGEVELVPPTWITLKHLEPYATAAEALTAIAKRTVPFYLTRRIAAKPPIVVWHGDAGYHSGDADAPGGRHRLTMDRNGWIFEEPDAP